MNTERSDLQRDRIDVWIGQHWVDNSNPNEPAIALGVRDSAKKCLQIAGLRDRRVHRMITRLPANSQYLRKATVMARSRLDQSD